MSITIECPECENQFTLPPESAGTQQACPGCGVVLEIPGPEEEAPPEAPKKKTRTLRRSCPDCGGKIPTGKSTCPDCGASYRQAKSARQGYEEEHGMGMERAAMNWGVLGGIGLIVIAAIWFFAGLAADIIFYYPPILAVIGIVGVFRGIAQGNLAGRQAERQRRRSSRSGPRRTKE